MKIASAPRFLFASSGDANCLCVASVAGKSWRNGFRLVALLLCCALSAEVTAQVTPSYVAGQELQRQQERERVLREQQERMPDVRLPAAATDETGRFPEAETPCFVIREIVLKSDLPAFDWALAAAEEAGDPATGRCLGSAGISLVMRRVQNAIVARGYVTTRVLAEAQDLRGGVLTLTVIPGRIRAIRFSDDSGVRANAWNAMPAKPGDLLNLRDIEQATPPAPSALPRRGSRASPLPAPLADRTASSPPPRWRSRCRPAA